jgi:hypothetical protein
MNAKLNNLLLFLVVAAITGCTQKNDGYKQGRKPGVSIAEINSGTVKKYEKFEVTLNLINVRITNPFDPADIDLYALFTAPSGRKIRINGFYDNYQGADKWKIRFSPSETGEYRFTVYVRDGSVAGESGESAFTAIDSEHHGWIRPSDKNRHYFSHDDGSSFYGVGAYSPWGNSEKVFSTYADNGGSLLAIWDISYGGFVNSTGIVENELGRYNQEKLGRIDSMLTILEKDGIKLMFAIWPHDLFSKTVWSAQWKQNPYSKITDVENVYSDSLAWEYQKMKYRYLIARFAHSRSWGIWELINEMDGTDGWAKGHHQEAYDWVKKCTQYFRENDPYHHPVTASFSGGFEQYREPLYKLIDIPNIHLYPAQGWKLNYPADTMRSDMLNFAWASRRFWDSFEKPAIFGEAGADLSYYKPKRKEYHVSYHNQVWASLANGLACTPVWWDFPVLNEQDWQTLKHLSEFVSDIDFANIMYQPVKAEAAGTDVFVMDSGEKAFGWARCFSGKNISKTRISIARSGNENCTVTWFDTWNGNVVKSQNVRPVNGILEFTVPELTAPFEDIAFKITQ